MNDENAPTTRARILDAARALFAERGFQSTSVREIAERVGLTKTAVLYHFASKADILAALAQPLLDGLAGALDRATSPDLDALRWQVFEGVLDVYLAHRRSLQLVLRDLALFVQEPVFARFVEVMTRANRMVAGRRPDLAARVRAAQGIAMLSDPVILLADVPAETLRGEVLRGVARLFGARRIDSAGSAPPRREVGRPQAMSAEAVEAARKLQASGKYTMAEIAARVGVSRATLYRKL